MTAVLEQQEPAATGPDPELPLCDIVLDSVRTEVEVLRRVEPLVRAEAPDAVIEMRVATRKLRGILLGFDKVFVRSRVRPVADQLKWLGAELAGERDTEMMLERLTTVLDVIPHDLVLGPVQKDLDRTLGKRSARYEKSLLHALDSGRYRRLLRSLDRLVAQPPLRPKARRAGQRQLTTSLARATRLLDRHLSTAIELPGGPDRDEEMHEARKAAKRVRHMVEAVAPTVGKPAKRLRRRAKKLMNLLGEHQDTVVIRPTLRELGITAHARGHNAFTYGLLYTGAYWHSQQVQEKLPAQRERLRAVWQKHWQEDRPKASLPPPGEDEPAAA